MRLEGYDPLCEEDLALLVRVQSYSRTVVQSYSRTVACVSVVRTACSRVTRSVRACSA